MQLDKLTQRNQEALQKALALVRELKHQQIDEDHFSYALLQENGVISALLKGFGLNKSDLLAKLEAAFAKKPTVEGGQEPFLSNNLNAIFQEAERIAQKMKDQFIAQEHIF